MRFLGLLVLTLAGCSAELSPTLEPRAPMSEHHFTVMSFNVHKDRSNDATTISAIGGANADIVCLQEVTSAWESVIRARYESVYPHMLFAPKENAGGLAVLSKFPLIDRGVVPVPGNLHPGWVLETAPFGTRVQLLVVHLRSLFNGTSDWVSNYFNTDRDHVREMNLFLARVRDDIPTIVAGDFNESPKGDAVRILEDRGFLNALRAFHPEQYTWRGTVLNHKMTIDHIMVGQRFDVLDSWVGEKGRSDHLPVLVHLEPIE
jgi:endonuclease/exonuclease/phosphatase family metal-dependent hydrolase